MILDKFSLHAWCKVPCSFVKFLERFFKGRLAVVAAKILCWAFIPSQNCFYGLFIVYNICIHFPV